MARAVVRATAADRAVYRAAVMALASVSAVDAAAHRATAVGRAVYRAVTAERTVTLDRAVRQAVAAVRCGCNHC